MTQEILVGFIRRNVGLEIKAELVVAMPILRAAIGFC